MWEGLRTVTPYFSFSEVRMLLRVSSVEPLFPTLVTTQVQRETKTTG